MADATPDITLSAWGPVEVPGLSPVYGESIHARTGTCPDAAWR